MEIQKATGIVLSARRSGEADIICTVLTREYGKRSFLFKGIKKSKRRPQASIEPGAIIRLVYYHHDDRDIAIVNDSHIEKYYPEIRKNLEKIYHLSFLLEATEKTTGAHDRDLPVFDLLAAGIDTLPGTEFCGHLSAFFTLHLLRVHGILPDMSRCRECGSVITGPFSLEMPHLRAVCGMCGGTACLLDRAAFDFINTSIVTKFNAIDHKAYGDEIMLDLIFHLALFIEEYFHTELKSKKFILETYCS